MSGEARLPITKVNDDGEPLEPKKNAHKFISQARVIVRDIGPISIADWHKPKAQGDEEASYVNETTKTLLWDTLLTYFNLPENLTDDKKEKVK